MFWVREMIGQNHRNIPPSTSGNPSCHLWSCSAVQQYILICTTNPKKKKSLEFLKPISFNFKKVNGPGQGNYASGAPRLWSPRSFNKKKFFFFFFNLVFDQRNLYVTLFTKKKKGFDEFDVRCWDLELDWWVLVSFFVGLVKIVGHSAIWVIGFGLVVDCSFQGIHHQTSMKTSSLVNQSSL